MNCGCICPQCLFSSCSVSLCSNLSPKRGALFWRQVHITLPCPLEDPGLLSAKAKVVFSLETDHCILAAPFVAVSGRVCSYLLQINSVSISVLRKGSYSITVFVLPWKYTDCKKSFGGSCSWGGIGLIDVLLCCCSHVLLWPNKVSCSKAT